MSDKEDGAKLIDSEDFEGAVKFYTRALLKAPSEILSGKKNLFVKRAEAHFKLGQLNDALKDVNSALEMDGMDEKALLLRCEIFKTRNCPSQALSDALKLEKLNPDFPDVATLISLLKLKIEEEANLSMPDAFSEDALIGKGQFSTVFRAKHLPSGKLYALKKILLPSQEGSRNYDFIMFTKELEVLKRLSHPNIIHCYGSFIKDEHLYMVLELAESGDLGKFIKKFKQKLSLIPEHVIWKVFVQICAGLKHMHSERTMHRDIKPANVFLMADGTVKLGDLGMARPFSMETLAAHTQVGTPYYMSPERIHGVGYHLPSDIWSLGCILYELAALQCPFYGDKKNLYSLCKKIEECIYPPLPSDLYSDKLHTVVAQCIKKDPDQRPDIHYLHSLASSMYQKYNSSDPLLVH